MFSSKLSNLLHVVNDKLPLKLKQKKVEFGGECKKSFALRLRPTFCTNDYTSDFSEKLSFHEGDILFVTCSNDPADKSGWLQAFDWRTGKAVMVWDNLVSEIAGEFVAFDAFQYITRSEAEEQLLLPNIKEGTFILRPNCDSNALALSLVMRTAGKPHVQHCLLKYDSTDEKYYIREAEKFNRLEELIKFYQDPTHPLFPVPLNAPCPKSSPDTEMFSDCIVSRNSITFRKRLSQGHFGEVWLATYRGVDVAVKKGLKNSSRRLVVEEAEAMYRLNHPRLVRFLGVCCEPITEPLLIITEFMPKGALENYLINEKPPYEELLRILLQVSEGMRYLETCGVVHNDLRTANVLVDADNSVKVADFGLAKILHNDERDKITGVYPIRWTAPEAMEFGKQYSIKGDVWSFGVLMYEVFTYVRYPYEDIESDDEVEEKIKDGYRMRSPEELGYRCNDKFYEKMLHCWDATPSNRPSFKDLHHFFQSSLTEVSKNA